jgi:hypothetical protein
VVGFESSEYQIIPITFNNCHRNKKKVSERYMNEFTDLERNAIDQILNVDLPGIDIAKQQIDNASVLSRECAGHGFFTKFSVPHSILPLPDDLSLRQRMFMGSTASDPSNPKELISFMLWEDEERYISCLEAVTSHGKWPQNETIVANKK